MIGLNSGIPSYGDCLITHITSNIITYLNVKFNTEPNKKPMTHSFMDGFRGVMWCLRDDIESNVNM